MLENIRRSTVNRLIFTSSSTVYGEPNIIPTSEDYGPLLPISPYGASKLACEALISSYCHTYGIEAIIFRLANIVGKRSNHGVIWDFITKLQRNPQQLDVLGDGNQTKSYLHVSDCIDCFFCCMSKNNNLVEVFNVGNEDSINIIKIAETISHTMGLTDVEIRTTKGTKNGRGWIGDVKQMQLSIEKLKKFGWTPKLNSNKAIQISTKDILSEKEVKNIV